jgi:hypothetical protein
MDIKNFKPSGKIINRQEKKMLLNLGYNWCGKCQSVKPKDQFFQNQYKCVDCSKQLRKQWVLKNPNHLDQWRAQNAEKRAAYNKKWHQKNKEKNKIKKRIWRAKQRKTNPTYRILNALRCRLYQKVTVKKISKSNCTKALVGCSLLELKKYLESLFLEGMTWENYGEWHIDHIKPCAAFDLSDPKQQKECFHYTNLQPLWAIDNIKKSDKF